MEYSGIFNTGPRIKKGNIFFKHTIQELKSKKLLLVKDKDDPNTVRFYTGFEIYDTLIAVFKCLEPKGSKFIFGKAQTNAKMRH